jgi:hypothetical protein
MQARACLPYHDCLNYISLNRSIGANVLLLKRESEFIKRFLAKAKSVSDLFRFVTVLEISIQLLALR